MPASPPDAGRHAGSDDDRSRLHWSWDDQLLDDWTSEPAVRGENRAEGRHGVPDPLPGGERQPVGDRADPQEPSTPSASAEPEPAEPPDSGSPDRVTTPDPVGALDPESGEPLEPAGPVPADRPPVLVAPVRRLLSLALAGLSGVLAIGLVVGAQITHGSYAFVVFGVQVLFVVVWTVASQPPAPWVVAGVGLATAVAADVAAVWVRPASLAPLAYVTAGGFAAAVIGQLVRPAGRVRVTESLGSSLAVIVGVVAYASLIVLSRQPLGTQAIVACLIGAGVALLASHLADVIAPVPRVTPAVARGGAGVVIGAMLGTAAAGLCGYYLEGLSTLPTAIAGLAAAVVALMVDLSASYAEAGRMLAGAAPALWLVRHIQGPVASFALAAPAAYAASTLLARGL